MKRSITLLFLFVCSVSFSIHAQSNRTKFADNYFNSFNFIAAIKNYKNLVGNEKVDQKYVLTKLGDSYRLINDTKNAEYWYAKAVIFDSVPSTTVYHYGQMLTSNAKYSAAIPVYERYRSMEPEENHITSIIERLKLLVQLEKYKMPEIYEVEIANVNSDISDFSPIAYKDNLYFASNRNNPENSNKDVWTNASFLQIYKAPILDFNSFGEVELLSKNVLNGKYHDGPICIDPSTDELYVTRSNYIDKKTIKDKDKNVKLKLIRIQKDENGTWAEGAEIDDFPYNNPTYSVGHATITADGNTMYFVSDMPHVDAQGGVDLYQCNKVGGVWTNLKNLGPTINTKGEERFPFVDEDGTLYFSSDGHPKYGGMDLFAATLDKDGNWSRAMNLGPPMNTNYDDFAFFKQGKQGYFASNRPSEFGDDNIYSFKEIGIRFFVNVYDENTGEPICNSNVEIKRNNELLYNLQTDCEGVANFTSNVGGDFFAEACINGYRCNDDEVSVREPIEPGSKVFLEIPLKSQNDALAIRVIPIDKETKQPIPNATVNVLNNDNGELFNQTNDRNAVRLSPEIETYKFNAVAIDYYPRDTVLNFADLHDDQDVFIEMGKVEKLVVDKESEGLVFYHIYYDFDESYIQVAANPYLQIVLDFMKENEAAFVNIEAHTDSRASNKYNIELSERRAEAAKNWLVERGIDEIRLKAKGMGEKYLVNKCADNVECTEEEHQLNRRTEFRIVSGSIDIRSLAPFNVSINPIEANN